MLGGFRARFRAPELLVARCLSAELLGVRVMRLGELGGALQPARLVALFGDAPLEVQCEQRERAAVGVPTFSNLSLSVSFLFPYLFLSLTSFSCVCFSPTFVSFFSHAFASFLKQALVSYS